MLWGHVKGSLDLGMFLFALSFGALGAAAHCLFYFTGALGAQGEGFDWNRLGWYGPQPPLGAILGALVYVAIRGGLLAASSGASAVNIFGVAAIGAVGGLSASRAYKALLAGSGPLFGPGNRGAGNQGGNQGGNGTQAGNGNPAPAPDQAPAPDPNQVAPDPNQAAGANQGPAANQPIAPDPGAASDGEPLPEG